jgi:hypothetical protein
MVRACFHLSAGRQLVDDFWQVVGEEAGSEREIADDAQAFRPAQLLEIRLVARPLVEVVLGLQRLVAGQASAGAGIERLAMLKYGIPDLRTFFESDLRWLRHYGFESLNIPSMVSGL